MTFVINGHNDSLLIIVNNYSESYKTQVRFQVPQVKQDLIFCDGECKNVIVVRISNCGMKEGKKERKKERKPIKGDMTRG